MIQQWGFFSGLLNLKELECKRLSYAWTRWDVKWWIIWISFNSPWALILVGGYVILWSKEEFNCFHDYSDLEPMKHDFVFFSMMIKNNLKTFKPHVFHTITKGVFIHQVNSLVVMNGDHWKNIKFVGLVNCTHIFTRRKTCIFDYSL